MNSYRRQVGRRGAWSPAVLGAACLVVAAAGASAQEPDSLAAPVDSVPDPESPSSCTLTWRPIAPNTRAQLLRDGPEMHTSYVSGRMLWTCGTATMEADSAVKSDRLRKVDLIGNVVYVDSIRSLRSDLLTYFEVPDLVIATQDVSLERAVDGSSLTGPYVEFLRAVSGVDEQTTATGRPHMTFYPEGDEPQEPFEIDADRAVFAGEDEARFFGDVILARSDVDAEADSAYLTRSDGLGLLWGDPWVEAEQIRLEGDTIRFHSEDEELRDVHALGNGFARGEQFEVRGELIDIELENEEVERVWAHGAGISEALSGAHLLYGDSLRFALFQSQIDTVFAVGEAVAIQGDSTAAASGLAGVEPLGGESGAELVADSTGIVQDSTPAGADLGDAEPGPLEIADSLGLAEAIPGALDTLASQQLLDTLGVDPETLPGAIAAGVRAGAEPGLIERLEDALPDSTRPSDLMAQVLDSAQPGADTVVIDSDDPAPSSSGRASLAPRLPTDGSTNWVRGDTLIAIFVRPGRPVAVDSTTLVGDSTTAPPAPVQAPIAGPPSIVGELPADSTLSPGPVSADSTADPVMERLIVIGAASAFYRQVRDSTASEEPSRNYMIGTRIQIVFQDGEPHVVTGENAIGIFLEPEEGIRNAQAQPADPAVDTTGRGPAGPVPGDTLRTAPGDTSGVRPDSTGAPPDTLGARPDSVEAPPDSLEAPPDTTRAGSRTGGARAATWLPDPPKRSRSGHRASRAPLRGSAGRPRRPVGGATRSTRTKGKGS